MVATPVSPRTVQPPPELPALPGISPTFTDYLRRFSLWCRNGFADKLSATVATPNLMMLAPGGTVFNIAIGDDGRLTSAPMAMGTGALGTSLKFAPATGSATGALAAPAGVTGTTYRMMGLALTLTSSIETGFSIEADGQLSNNLAAGGAEAVICFGTGVPPLNGAAQVGTIVGSSARFTAVTAGAIAPFAITRRTSPPPAITPATVYWFDLALRAFGGGTASAANLNMNVRGLA